MNVKADLPSRRMHLYASRQEILRTMLTAAVFLSAFCLQTDAGEIRTSFRDLSPRSRVPTFIKNGTEVTLKVTLQDPTKKGIPGKIIKFKATTRAGVVVVDKSAVTDTSGQAIVKAKVQIKGLKGSRWIPVEWTPTFEGDPPYRGAQNNNLGGGFRVVP